jgi:carbamoyl-phosphate synthase small subunit
MNLSKQAILVLEDGRSFRGKSFGAEGEAFGEMVFNTSMSGYQEILTDPSYAGQIVCMTYPLIGNYGTNSADCESEKPWAEGFVVKEASRIASNFRSQETLDSYLKRNNIVGIESIDTRALVRHIRNKGAMRTVISTADLSEESLLEKVKSSPEMTNRNLADKVSTDKIYEFPADSAEKFHVVCYDFGVKTNSLKEFAERGCRLTIVPAKTSAEDVLNLKPNGIFLSNGPGDPSSMKSVIGEIKRLTMSGVPMFGICLGHQLLSLAFGGTTYKMLFGHRGGNQPIKDLSTGKVEITAHNHGFAVEKSSLPSEVEITHINLNDETVAGIKHRTKPIFSVQYHPEASPGPNDAKYHFDRFIELMKSDKHR